MAPSVVNALVIAASAASPAMAMSVLRGSSEAESLQTVTMHMHRADCGKSRALSKFALSAQARAKMPGAGMDPNIKPFEKVLKDGFFEVACVKDMLFTYGDKHHDNKAEYNLGDIANVSIVHYDSLVVKEDKEPMTHEVCFDFCRTIPDMSFFGLQNGRMCYCAPYFKAMESDSSECDAVCDGNPSTMCGGNTKSSMFGMHECATTAADLTDAQTKMAEAAGELSALEAKVGGAAKRMQETADLYQAMMGAAGDPVAADLFQTAKVYAGELEKAAAEAKKETTAMDELKATGSGLQGKDFSKSEDARSAEAAIEGMEKATTAAVASAEGLEELAEKSVPELDGAVNASKLYYPAMYFVDKEFKEVPSTCGGTAAEKPLIGTMDTCARACDNDIHECVGFSFFPMKAGRSRQVQGQGGRGGMIHTFLQLAEDSAQAAGEGVCFLFSKMKSVTYYTKCEKGKKGGQVDVSKVQCVVKFAEFEGVTLKPDPSGKCDICLKEAKKADRCPA